MGGDMSPCSRQGHSETPPDFGVGRPCPLPTAGSGRVGAIPPLRNAGGGGAPAGQRSLRHSVGPTGATGPGRKVAQGDVGCGAALATATTASAPAAAWPAVLP